MTSDAINYLRNNPVVAAKKVARSTTIYGPKGGLFLADGEIARGILERAMTRHYRNGCKPTAVRLSIDQIRAFPLMEKVGHAEDIGWLVVVTDAYGRSAYGITVEGSPLIDAKTRATLARSSATKRACEVLADYARADLQGSAGQVVN